MYEFCQIMFNAGIDIRPYVELGAITAEQYEEITGEPFVKTEEPA